MYIHASQKNLWVKKEILMKNLKYLGLNLEYIINQDLGMQLNQYLES